MIVLLTGHVPLTARAVVLIVVLAVVLAALLIISDDTDRRPRH